MIVKKVNRYWCDHCKKAALQKRAMEKHEAHCTMNPHRSCRVCNLFNGGSHGLSMAKLVALLPDSKPYHAESVGDDEHMALTEAVAAALPSLREATGDCPACIMAALRQANIPVPMADGFDFKREMAEIFDVINTERFQAGGI